MDPAGLCIGPGICVREDQVGVFFRLVCTNLQHVAKKRAFPSETSFRAHVRAHARAYARIYIRWLK